ncbi:MAG: DUF2085 domain-containing protein [Anaerolineales bacterium]|nr:DUF2085 domain-containing protein [Anaerolineales bacterium]
MLIVTLYKKENCDLCDHAMKDLESLKSKYPYTLVAIDISQNPDLQKKYGLDIPVIEVGPYVLKAPFDLKKLLVTMAAASNRVEQLKSIDDSKYDNRVKRGKSISWGDRFTAWFSIRYMLVFNLLVLLYVGLPFLAPVLVKQGARTPAMVIYHVYGGLCHQLAFRSWFLFGEQLAYPRAAADVEGLITFGEATGMDENDIWGARKFIGNDIVGYKVALCERDVAIYSGILIFGLLFSLTGRKIKSLNIILWILIGLMPIGIDGVSQIVSQLPFGVLPYRESTPLLRTITGFLFGFSTAWFGYPLIEETMQDARNLMTKKFAKVETIRKSMK